MAPGGLSELFARANQDPASRDLHTWGSPPDALARELDELAHPVVVTEPGGQAALVLDVAPDQRRAWAWGPAVLGGDRDARATVLLERALAALPAEIERISSFPHQGAWLVDWWIARGAVPASVVHVYRAVPAGRPEAPATVRPATEADLSEVAPLHAAAFPATYLSAAEMLSGAPRRRLFVDDAGRGYVCAEVQADGTGYVHFLAVVPDARRQGVGSGLLRAALGWLVDEGAPEVTLTVADRNDARRLYHAAGFELLASGQALDLTR